MEEVGAALEAYGVTNIRRVHEDAEWKASYAEDLRKKTDGWIPDPLLWFDLDTGDLPLQKRYKLFHVLSESALIEAMDFEYIGVDGNSVATRALRLLGMQSTHKKKLRPYVVHSEKWYFLEWPHNATSTYIYLRFAHGSKVRLREGKLVSLGGPPEEQEKLREVNAFLERFEISKIERDTLLSEEEVERDKKEMEKLTGKESHDRNLSFKVIAEHLSDEDKLDVVNGLNALDIIERASLGAHAVECSDKLSLGPLIGGLLPGRAGAYSITHSASAT